MLWYYIIVLHVLSTPKYDTEQLEWSDDIMHFDIVVYWCKWAERLQTYGPKLGFTESGPDEPRDSGPGGQNSDTKHFPCNLVDVVIVRAPVCVYAFGMCATGCSCNYI